MQVTWASEAGRKRPNEDYAVTGPDWAVVLDGATAPPDTDSGCIHDVRWFVRQLAAAVAARMPTAALSLADLLAEAITVRSLFGAGNGCGPDLADVALAWPACCGGPGSLAGGLIALRWSHCDYCGRQEAGRLWPSRCQVRSVRLRSLPPPSGAEIRPGPGRDIRFRRLVTLEQTWHFSMMRPGGAGCTPAAG